ncbi:hypothetical protein Acr_17g0005500 [Actinidia rufa]|uniref:Uncharacterized protein n=1 Tax=Actinidia rufa TaxID=165716 RepID=A0A7J0G2J3_9ERIC|nr:hypothetical protein Acr_17g0005500 [Actinidia rufa]
MRTRVSSRFKLATQLKVYEGKTDPMDHLDSYKNLMILQGSDRDVRKKTNDRHPHIPPRLPNLILPPLNTPIAQVLTEIKHEEFIKWPWKIKIDPHKRNKNKYCEFHQDHERNTEDYFQLKEQIADMIKRGYLEKYVANRPCLDSPDRRYGDNRPTAGDIQVIHDGFGSKGCSSSSQKRHVREASRREEKAYNLSSSLAIAH